MWVPALLLMMTAASVAGEIVEFLQCPDYKMDGAVVSRNCSVHAVRVHPCAEAAYGQPCKIRKGQAAGISFSYTPDESAEQVKAVAYWHGNMGDVAFQGMDTDGCHFTSCPLTAGARANYSYDLQISRKFPSREYSVMWKLWNKGEPVKFECCFIVRIKILGVGKN
ncbi:MD-2-related lipid-recognition protein-like [Schistocerca cancellata]|uniref:MD-2-related lipid-recognition protein-like n=1 Tax=Schistocerca cancellata TaxID=274614 RepID=UPI0021191484|nr:MD-2-related lipid-recognition protein-like [Schistocerca cancellata]